MTALPMNFHSLIETFPAPGCVVCNLTERDVNRFLDSHLYEYVNTPETHADIRASRGLCATHAGHLVEFGASVLGITILHAVIMDEILKTAAESNRAAFTFGRLRGSTGSNLAKRLEPTGTCMACDALERAEKVVRTQARDPREAAHVMRDFRLAVDHPDDSRHACQGTWRGAGSVECDSVPDLYRLNCNLNA